MKQVVEDDTDLYNISSYFTAHVHKTELRLQQCFVPDHTLNSVVLILHALGLQRVTATAKPPSFGSSVACVQQELLLHRPIA